MDVQVGNYLLVRSDENIPADMVIISTSESDSLCFVEVSIVRILTADEKLGWRN